MGSRLLTIARTHVAATRQPLSRPDTRILWTKLVIVTGFLCGFLLSPKLWVSTRFFPLIPVIHGLPRISYPLDYVYFAALIVLLVCIALSSRPRIYIAVFVALTVILCVLDQTRWQPWVYQYLLMLIALGCCSWKPGDILGQEDALNICRLIMGCTYFYSGLQKMNAHFVAEGFPWVLDTLHVHFPGMRYLAWIAACIEVSIGITLLTRKFRKLGMVNGVIMHLFILYSFGPLGRNWNSVVWPWNVVMIALILLLFWNTDVTFFDIVWRNRLVYQKVVLVLFGVLPFLSFFGKWPSDLSSALYTGNIDKGDVLMAEHVIQDLPPAIQGYVKTYPGNRHVLQILVWSFGDMNVPPYAEIQSFRSAGAEICRYSHNSPDVLLLVQEKNTLLGKGKLIQETCFGTLVR